MGGRACRCWCGLCLGERHGGQPTCVVVHCRRAAAVPAAAAWGHWGTRASLSARQSGGRRRRLVGERACHAYGETRMHLLCLEPHPCAALSPSDRQYHLFIVYSRRMHGPLCSRQCRLSLQYWTIFNKPTSFCVAPWNRCMQHWAAWKCRDENRGASGRCDRAAGRGRPAR